ncbi:hypothetical protein LAX5112_04709 [Roseibium alexandrii]|uniref:Uncharacterized protein n=1 Tax=Roseibium alexandrii TaxID=388408 RepID=A0A0M7AT93_9HYPH|nr:hypothetical protein LAX5112_04709 [Roseibium alexandrii]
MCDVMARKVCGETRTGGWCLLRGHLNLASINASNDLGQGLQPVKGDVLRHTKIDQAGDLIDTDGTDLLHTFERIGDCAEQPTVFKVAQESKLQDRVQLVF